MSIQKNRKLMTEQIKRLKGELKESVNDPFDDEFDPKADYFYQTKYIPKIVYKVLDKYDYEVDAYDTSAEMIHKSRMKLIQMQAAKAQKALKKVGWSVKYDSNGILHNLRPIGKYDPFKESVNEEGFDSSKDELNEKNPPRYKPGKHLDRIYAKEFPPNMTLRKIVDLYDTDIIRYYKTKSKHRKSLSGPLRGYF